jgi:D-3-phosphoglycerate dehydrogenase
MEEEEAGETKRVLITDHISEYGIKKLRQFAEVDIELGLSEEELKECILGYDALIVRSGTKVTKGIIEAGGRLRVIGRAGIGVDNIDVGTATEKGILVVNAPEANVISAAEHTIALLLSLCRKIAEANVSLKSGKWERKKHIGVEVNGKVLGIIGLGKIGGEVAKRASGLGMKVIAYDPFISPQRVKELGISLLTLDEVLSASDFISLHTPLTKETYHMIGREAFEKMKEGVRIINCARGGIIDEEALKEAIKRGKVAGAALDVFEKEPPFSDESGSKNEFLSMEEIIVTPHLGASTEEAQRVAAVIIAEEVLKAMNNEPVKNAVNMIYVAEELMEGMKPYLILAEKLGKLSAQLLPSGGIEEINVVYAGEIAAKEKVNNTKLVTVAMLKGFLSLLSAGVNYVNAPLIAKKFGIKVTESRTEDVENFSSLINVVVRAGSEENTVSGTLFGKDDLRIVKIDKYRVDASPSGYMLICSFIDRPRVIGPVCMILGDRGVNIAGMQVGREKIGGEAVMVLNVDNPVNEDTLKEIKSVENILDVKLVKL